ncbi:Methyltransferase small domain-containing protein [Rathayibacter oskolensis]|uniref:Methyltransferase small domain-containing protein n=1 Tax=Rathayibacter oskolensis TaxID=1891671 RepID=A0A1X7N5K7_9MICO|nr:methyltransferase [Rathayibacter oskolensis]SMH32709.1 Methyltransferase small domain-containing protein [Rathayibacter oskolensis]
MQPADQLDPALVALLREDLARARYRVDAVRELWGEAAGEALHRGDRVPARRALERAGDSGPLVSLARLFLLADPISAESAGRAFSTLGLDGAIELGLVVAEAGAVVTAAIDLRPYDLVDLRGAASWWIASDLGELALGRALDEDHVLGVGGASLTLTGLMIQRAVGSVLDLGTGCGIQALHASRHAQRVVATDISERAISFAAFNAALNGIDTIEFRLGSLYEPVAGERFDHIVTNPPFVITPRAAGVPSYEYRDGGLEGDEIVHRVVVGAAEHLVPGGIAQLLGNWEYRESGDAFDRVRGWLDDARSPLSRALEPEPAGLDAWMDGTASPLDVWIVERERQDPAVYAETWIRDGGTTRGADFDLLVDAWVGDFERRGVTGVGFGYVTLRLPATARPPLRRFERIDAAFATAGLGGHLADCLDAAEALSGIDDAALAGLALSVAGDVTEERHYWPGNDDPTVLRLRQGGGFARVEDVDTALAAVVGASDGELSLGAIVSAVASLLQVDEAAVRESVLPQVRELVATGMLHLP